MTDLGHGRRTVGLRKGGRSERVVASILESALTELAAVGYAALRVDDVAIRAGVAKTTVYRRWPTKSELVHAAIRVTASSDDELPDTGDVRRDIALHLDRSIRILATPAGRALARLVTTEGGDPEVDRLCRALKEEIRAHRRQIIVRAQSRGDLPREVDADLVMDCIFTVVMSRIVRFGETIDRPTRERLIDLVVTGAEHGGGTKPPSNPASSR